MVVGFTTTYAISAYHHLNCEFESHSWLVVLDTTLCDKVCQWLATGQWFSLCTPVFSTNKTDCHDITEILLKVALDAMTLKTNNVQLINWISALIVVKHTPVLSFQSVFPNKYDALVRYHQGASLAAHGGPAFVAWHRFYLVL